MRTFLVLIPLASCTAPSPVLTTPAQLAVRSPSEAASETRGLSAYAIARDPTIIAFTHSPPGTDCRLAEPPFAKLSIVFSRLPPLVEIDGPPPIAIDVAVIAPIFSRSGAQLDLVPATREPIGILYPDDDDALVARFRASALSLDGATQLAITGSYAVDVCE